MRRAGFPWRAPTWPGGVERPAPARTTGIDYDTAWARRYPVRLARAVVVDAVTRPLVRVVASPTVAGLDRLTVVRGPVVFAANHASHVDTPLLLASLPERFRHRCVVAAGADYFFDTQWKAALWAFAVNAVPVERTRVSPRSTRLATGLVTAGWNLVIFPEGGRSPDGWGQEHRPGAAWVAMRAGVPVVPVHLEGTRRILKKGGRGLRRARTAVTFGRPLSAHPEEDARAFAARIAAEIAALADEQAGDWWSARRRAASGHTPALTGPASSQWRRAWATGEARRTPPPAGRWPWTTG